MKVGDTGLLPPPRTNGTLIRQQAALIDAWVDRLKANPGVWMCVNDFPGRAASRGPYEKRGCYVTTRAEGGKTYLWAMWPCE